MTAPLAPILNPSVKITWPNARQKAGYSPSLATEPPSTFTQTCSPPPATPSLSSIWSFRPSSLLRAATPFAPRSVPPKNHSPGSRRSKVGLIARSPVAASRQPNKRSSSIIFPSSSQTVMRRAIKLCNSNNPKPNCGQSPRSYKPIVPAASARLLSSRCAQHNAKKNS